MTSENSHSGARTIRSFLATPVTESLADALMASVEASRNELPSLRVTARDNLHLTLVFLGNLTEQELDHSVIPRVNEIVDQSMPGRIYFRQVASFPSKEQPRHLVLEGYGSPSAEALQDALRQSLQELTGNQKPKTWRPHITLGRLKDSKASGVTPTPWRAELPIGEIALYESQTTIHGPVYRVRHRWSLGQPAA